MTDIVEWLRTFRISSSDSNFNAVVVNKRINEAADEIERLREEIKMMKYYLPENIDFVRCSEGKDHFSFEIVYKELGEEE